MEVLEFVGNEKGVKGLIFSLNLGMVVRGL